MLTGAWNFHRIVISINKLQLPALLGKFYFILFWKKNWKQFFIWNPALFSLLPKSGSFCLSLLHGSYPCSARKWGHAKRAGLRKQGHAKWSVFQMTIWFFLQLIIFSKPPRSSWKYLSDTWFEWWKMRTPPFEVFKYKKKMVRFEKKRILEAQNTKDLWVAQKGNTLLWYTRVFCFWQSQLKVFGNRKDPNLIHKSWVGYQFYLGCSGPFDFVIKFQSENHDRKGKFNLKN